MEYSLAVFFLKHDSSFSAALNILGLCILFFILHRSEAGEFFKCFGKMLYFAKTYLGGDAINWFHTARQQFLRFLYPVGYEITNHADSQFFLKNLAEIGIADIQMGCNVIYSNILRIMLMDIFDGLQHNGTFHHIAIGKFCFELVNGLDQLKAALLD